MTIGHDELTRPLGLETARPRGRALRLPWGKIVAAAFALLFLALAGWLAVARDPFGGEPYAIAPIQRPAPVAIAPEQPAGSSTGPAVRTVTGTETQKDHSTAAELEDASGVRVTRGGGDAPESVIIRVPQPTDRLAPAPDRRLVERSRHGALPKIGSDGARPAEVYARPAPPAPAKPMPRIAIVVGGMGLSQTTTSDAVTKLPDQVTLAFAPYGTEIERQVARAREGGHEVLLQVPMEPFDYPDNDPGPHTLTTSAPPAETMDRLYWVMSRFPGYIGVMNHLGGKFTANEQALLPVMRDLGGRGLVYLDDGSSARSLAPTLANAARLPASKADVVIDTRPRANVIDEQLARLEVVARDKGSAIGVASALPVSVERIAQWAKTLEGRGFQLVPLSALVGKPPRA